MSYRLLKSEPSAYSWNQLIKDGKGMRDGVRSYQARNNLASMKVGDLGFFYHSNEGKEIVGICKIIKEHYPDATADDPRWVVVEVEPVRELQKSVTLADIKANPRLTEIKLIRNSRLSVIPILQEEWDEILKMSGE